MALVVRLFAETEQCRSDLNKDAGVGVLCVTETRGFGDDASLIAIDGSVATSDELMAATMALGRALGQFDTNDMLSPLGRR
jgi:hypothetical protein